MSGQCRHIVIIWHLSLRALNDSTQRYDLGSGHFSPHPEMTRPQVLKISGVLISFHRRHEGDRGPVCELFIESCGTQTSRPHHIRDLEP